MKLRLLLTVLCFALAEAVVAHGAQSPAAADQAAVVEGNNAFATALYARLRGQSGDLFFSPESVSIALSMTYAGARGETATQMAQTLHFTLPSDRLHPAMGALLSDLNAAHTGYQLRVANALWAQQGYTFLEPFLALMESDYGANFNQVDFKGATEAARSAINEWVEQKTEDKIKDLIPPGALDRETRLVLANAIYFKGDWETQFDKAQTKDEDFHLSASQAVKAPLMHREGGFNYFNGSTFQVLEIPYKSRDLSMIVLLPNEADGLSALEESMTPAGVKQWLGQLRPVPKVVLTLPRFKMTRQFSLASTLAAMGMPKAFDRHPQDFTGMTARPELYISDVVHKAFVDVNEEGTEAAAATGVIVSRALAIQRPRPPIVFRADHPFLFLIRENLSGAILFMGRVADPTR
ncbi:MAG: serpin family protein [Terracidiphilus sp.]